MIQAPNDSEFNAYYLTYISKVGNEGPEAALLKNMEATKERFAAIPESKGTFSYAPGKWTVKQVIQHLIDTERIMAYRALRVARGDQSALVGFDQDIYADATINSKRTVAELAEEFELVRRTSLHLIKGFTEEDLLRMGTASNSPVSTRALIYIMAGHEIHHLGVLQERYDL